MIALIQRVTRASVAVNGDVTGEIGPGLLVLLGVEKEDTPQKSQRLCERVLGYRVFSDENGKMNLNVQQAGGSVLVVSQFTLRQILTAACVRAFPTARRLNWPRRCMTISSNVAVRLAQRHKPGALPQICRCPW